MSITPILQSHVGHLVTHLAPAMGGPRARDLYVFNDIVEAMGGPWRDKIDRQACGYLRREFDRFVEGGIVSVALDPFEKRFDAFLAILYPPEERVFALRVRAPYPGIRVFGCFADTNIFVATNWERRDLLPNSEGGSDPDTDEWKKERQICLARWRQVAQPYDPHEGNTIHDYINPGAVPA
jgi:hypothetical protein